MDNFVGGLRTSPRLSAGVLSGVCYARHGLRGNPVRRSQVFWPENRGDDANVFTPHHPAR